jgi:hypothetical protein
MDDDEDGSSELYGSDDQEDASGGSGRSGGALVCRGVLKVQPLPCAQRPAAPLAAAATAAEEASGSSSDGSSPERRALLLARRRAQWAEEKARKDASLAEEKARKDATEAALAGWQTLGNAGEGLLQLLKSGGGLAGLNSGGGGSVCCWLCRRPGPHQWERPTLDNGGGVAFPLLAPTATAAAVAATATAEMLCAAGNKARATAPAEARPCKHHGWAQRPFPLAHGGKFTSADRSVVLDSTHAVRAMCMQGLRLN